MRLLDLGIASQPALAIASADNGWRVFEGTAWFGLLLVVLGIGAAVLAVLRRRFRQIGDGRRDIFTLEELRRIRAAGELSDEEFARLRSQLVRTFGHSDES